MIPGFPLKIQKITTKLRLCLCAEIRSDGRRLPRRRRCQGCPAQERYGQRQRHFPVCF